MAEKSWKDLWLENYKYEGDCKDLKEYAKVVDFGAKKGGAYLPWAIVERIFKLQDGEYKVIEHVDNDGNESIVHCDKFLNKVDFNDEGVMTAKRYIKSYFIDLLVKWHGREYTEHYPLQSSNAQPLTIWTQNDLNTAIQRAKVKAIANVSGIGYSFFEGELQFGEDAEKEQENKADKLVEDAQKKGKINTGQEDVEKKKPVKKAEEKPEEKPEKEPEVDRVEDEEKDAKPSEKKELKNQKQTIPEDRIEIENAIKETFMTGGLNKTEIIQNFLEEKGTKKIQELSLEDIQDLYVKIQ